MKTIFLFAFLFMTTMAVTAQTSQWHWGKYGANGKGEATAVATDGSGNIYITGYTHAYEIFFGTDTIPDFGNTDVFIVKYDPEGNPLWAKSFGTPLQEEAWDIATDHSGNILIAGHYGASMIFGGDTLQGGSGGAGFLVKFDPSGNVLWTANTSALGSDIYSICSDSENNIFVAGVFGGSVGYLGYTFNCDSAAWTVGCFYCQARFFGQYAMDQVIWRNGIGCALREFVPIRRTTFV